MQIRCRERSILDSVPRICFFIQTAFGTGFTYLTSGAFLSGLAILMGAGDVLISYLSVILNICGVLILFFSSYLERFQSYKKLAVTLTVLSKLATLFIVIIPVIVPENLQLAVFILTVIVAFTLQAQATVILNQWMMGFIDERKSGRYVSFRQTLSLIVTAVLSMTSGVWMDSMQGRYTGFAVLFAAAAVMGFFEVIILTGTPDSIAYRTPNQRCRLRDIARLPLKNRRFTRFVLYILLFYMLLYISDSFTMVYMMKYLEMPYRAVTTMSLILSLPQVILLGLWGRASDKYGHEFVLRISIWLFAGETFFLAFASAGTCYIFIPIAFLISSAANSGFVIAVFNRRYELMPNENRIVYDNFFTAVVGLGFILGPMIGGMIKKGLESAGVLENIMPFAGIRLLYVVSTVGLLLLQMVYRILRNKEKI